MLDKKQIQKNIAKELNKLSYDLVEFRLSEHSKTIKLSLFIDKLGSKEEKCLLNVGECSIVSKSIATFIDKTEIFGVKDYYLEVSTPGIERKLNTIADFERFLNKNCKVSVKGEDYKKTLYGKIVKVFQDKFNLELEDKSVITIDFASIQNARLRY